MPRKFDSSDTIDRIIYEEDQEVVYNVASNEGSRRVKQKTGAEYVHTVIQDYHSGECESEVWRVDRDAWLARRKG